MAYDLSGVQWIKSTHSQAGGDCVEVAFTSGAVLVRDSKNRSGSVLRFTTSEWRAFVAGVSDGEFDLL